MQYYEGPFSDIPAAIREATDQAYVSWKNNVLTTLKAFSEADETKSKRMAQSTINVLTSANNFLQQVFPVGSQPYDDLVAIKRMVEERTYEVATPSVTTP